jgi:hypothetical protein
MQGQYLRRESSHRPNEIDEHFPFTGVQAVNSEESMPEDGPARIVPWISRFPVEIAACSTRRPEPLLTRTHGGVEARSGPVQRSAGAAAEGAQAIGCSFAEIGDTVGQVGANVVSPVIAGYAASDRAKDESKQSVPFP